MLAALDAAARASGLRLRGGFRLDSAERTGPLAQVRTFLLLGLIGAEGWPEFAASPEASDGRGDPLDRWSRRIIGGLAAEFDATPLFPFEGPPYWPFQQWARRAEPVTPSPLGLLIHPTYGLWHSYRGALAFAETIDLPLQQPQESPCARCQTRPCLSACPVGAFTEAGYDVAGCAGWLRGGATCMSSGCLARNACPEGASFRQSPAQSAFYMRAFLAVRD